MFTEKHAWPKHAEMNKTIWETEISDDILHTHVPLVRYALKNIFANRVC